MMFRWFRENAPVRLKLSIAFGAQALLVGIGCACGLLVTRGDITTYESIGITTATFILSVAWGYSARDAISIPYMRTVERMEDLAAGDAASRIAFTHHTDCVGRMAKAMQVFRDTGLERAKLQTEATEFQKNLDLKLRETQAAFEAAGQDQARVVDGLALALERLSKGDLLYRLNQTFPPHYEKLRADFNSAIENLQATITSIAANTQGVRQSAGEITQASDDLSRRTEQQAASLEQTAAALDEITATVRKSAEGAAEARNVVTAAKGDAERSGEVVRETVNAMSGIETSSKQIGNIIGVIDEIAFQTNLLALNAGVEAARAGDAGRGFAVVATEVRALAQRSADAAKEIKALISASGAQVQTGVKLVGETGKALARIVEQVNRLNVLVADIANSAREQATGLAEVNAAVNQMDQVTQQNAAMVEQTTGASHNLASEAEALSRLVAQFQIGAAQASAITANTPPPAQVTMLRKPTPAAKKSRLPVHAPTGKFVALARSAPATAAAEDWDEF